MDNVTNIRPSLQVVTNINFLYFYFFLFMINYFIDNYYNSFFYNQEIIIIFYKIVMAKSTSIYDLPKNDNSNIEETEESMMVNSILKEIENEEEVLNDENEDTLNYTMDTSQVPPKINNTIPSKEEIEQVTEQLFENPEPIPVHDEPEVLVKEPEVKNIEQILDNNSNSNKEENKDEPDNKDNKRFMPNIDNVMTNIRKRIIGPIIILILFVIITLPKISHLMIKVLPKIKGKSGDINTLGNFLKGLLIAFIYFIISFFI